VVQAYSRADVPRLEIASSVLKDFADYGASARVRLTHL